MGYNTIKSRRFLILPERNYNYIPKRDIYTAVYEEQFGIKDNSYGGNKTVEKRVIKRKNTKKNLLNFLLKVILVYLLLFVILPFSFKSFIYDIFPNNPKKMLKIDYHKLLYPTHHYLYKDLFLGRYILKDTSYSKALMLNIKETNPREGLKNRLLQLASSYKTIQPAIYVWEYDTGTYVDINADKVYPAASIIKIPVLIEMFRQIEQGKFTLNDTIILEDYYRASGSGKLQYSQGGIAHTMDYLAKIMIENSDNSSTNMIMSKIGGMPALNRAITKWGLKYTRVNNWLPDLQGTNVTTPRELAVMLYNIDKTNIISSDSKKHIADYLSHVKNNRLLQAGLPSNAILLHKTGDIGFMLGDAGIVKTSTGKKYIVVILAKRPYNSFKGKEFIVEASRIIYNNIQN